VFGAERRRRSAISGALARSRRDGLSGGARLAPHVFVRTSGWARTAVEQVVAQRDPRQDQRLLPDRTSAALFQTGTA
jgi:hypothetical protein